MKKIQAILTYLFPWSYNAERNIRIHKITGRKQQLAINKKMASSWDQSFIWEDLKI